MTDSRMVEWLESAAVLILSQYLIHLSAQLSVQQHLLLPPLLQFQLNLTPLVFQFLNNQTSMIESKQRKRSHIRQDSAETKITSFCKKEDSDGGLTTN